MQANVLSTVLLPVALGIIMYGLGLALTRDDFRRVLVYPRPVVLGLFCQTVLPGLTLTRKMVESSTLEVMDVAEESF